MLITKLSALPTEVPWSALFWVAGACVAFRFLFNRYGRGLNRIPGPFLASLSDFWRLFLVWQRQAQVEHVRLAEKYGRLVRIGPKTVLVSDPNAVRIIYGLNSGFVKSDFYPVQQTISKGRRLLTLFTTTDEVFHAKLRRAVNNAYAMSTLVQFEPLVDSTILTFLKQMQTRFADRSGPEGVCEFDAWLQYYAFDVIGELTYSKRLGFVDRGVDVDSIIANLQSLLNYASVIGQLPLLDRLLLKNPLRLAASRYNLLDSNSPVVDFAKARIASRPDVAKGEEKIDMDISRPTLQRDFLSRFYEAHRKDPEFMTHERVLAVTVANMFAGSDTTAITLRAIFYFLLKHPEEMSSLKHELSSQTQNVTDWNSLLTWNDVKDLPYLNAVVKETLRCHPAAGLPLERIVPPMGVTICGEFLPGGTIVGCSAWTLHRDPVFGKDPEQYRPRRWLDASPQQRRIMENSLFSFGAGARTCIGKNISLLEMYKLVPAVLTKFEITLADPKTAWNLHNAWFVKQGGFKVRLKSLKTVRDSSLSQSKS